MKTPEKELVKKKLLTLVVLVVTIVLLSIALLPNPINSREVSDAYARYINNPSEETKRAYEEARDRVNRPFHTLQTVCLISGILLPLVLIRVWRRRLKTAG